MNKKLLIVIVVLIGIALLVAIAWTLKHRQDQKNSELAAQINTCSTDQVGKDIKKDPTVLDLPKASLLKPFSDKIEKLADHEKSATCMFILTSYNAYNGDYTKAKKNYADLQSLKSKGVRIDGSFKLQSNNLDIFMKGIDDRVKQDKANFHTTGPGTKTQKAGGNGQ